VVVGRWVTAANELDKDEGGGAFYPVRCRNGIRPRLAVTLSQGHSRQLKAHFNSARASASPTRGGGGRGVRAALAEPLFI
jgi:hypothetical protein